MFDFFATDIRRKKYEKKVKDEHTNEEIKVIIKGDIHLSQLADAGFCFKPPNANSAKACGCKHGVTHYRTKK
jgi:hypothetical protein